MSRPSFEIAIPTYKRPDTLAAMTMPLLLSRGVPTEIIRVWTTGEEEAEIYREALDLFLPADQIAPHGGSVGVGNARNAVIDQYPTGTRLLQIDDDIKQFHRKVEEPRPREEWVNQGPFTEWGAKPVRDLTRLIEEGFDLADECGVSLWSTYPVKNPFFMGYRSMVGNLYAEGSFRAMTLRHDGTETVSLDHGEDFEQSIKHYIRDGGVLRLENYGFVTAFFKQAGGMQEYRTPGIVHAGIIDLVTMYPEYCSMKKPSKGNPLMVDAKLTRFRDTLREVRMVEVD